MATLLRFIFLLSLLGCGKHESTSYGVSNSSKNEQGTKAGTTEELFRKAILEGNRELFMQSIDAAVDINVRFADDKTPLIESVVNDQGKGQHAFFVFYLLQKGADASLKDRFDKTALDYAIQFSRTRIELMLNSEKSVELQEKLWKFVNSGSASDVTKQLNAGAIPNVQDGAGETPLTQAIKLASTATEKKKGKFVNVAETLINWTDVDFQVSTTDVNLPNSLGEKPLTLVLNSTLKESFKNSLLEALSKKGAQE